MLIVAMYLSHFHKAKDTQWIFRGLFAGVSLDMAPGFREEFSDRGDKKVSIEKKSEREVWQNRSLLRHYHLHKKLLPRHCFLQKRFSCLPNFDFHHLYQAFYISKWKTKVRIEMANFGQSRESYKKTNKRKSCILWWWIQAHSKLHL